MRGAGRPYAPAHAEEKARWIRGLFSRIVRRYDFLNHLLSFNQDRRWRARTACLLAPWLARPGVRVLDLCCGTADLLAALRCACPPQAGALFIGSDFCHPMLLAARGKLPDACLIEADALRLPLPEACVDVVTVAFGLRNLVDWQAGLAEMRRVLRAGGVAAVLEFSWPKGRWLSAAYGLYARHLLPRVGGWISGAQEAYAYLPDSVRRFPSAEQIAGWMQGAGFRSVRFWRMTGGIVTLHLGET